MKFWDSSAILPLLVQETRTSSVRSLFARDVQMSVWWGSVVECVSAIARLERERRLSSAGVQEALQRLGRLRQDWHEFHASEELREMAIRFVRVHPLRAADALQLAAAYLAAEGRPSNLEFVSLDERLSEAARREGFAITP